MNRPNRSHQPESSFGEASEPLKTKLLKAGLADQLAVWQELIDKDIEASFQHFGAMDSRLSEACRYALMSGGKRFRPAIVYMMAKAIGKQADVSQAALAVECFHTASLVADDFPCMDDDDMRRGRPSLHKQFGEGVALLASYALIAEGYAAIGRSGQKMKNKEWLPFVIECAAENTGARGATGGQYLDLFPPNLTKETVLQILKMKTVTLFELAFVLGWVFGEGDPAEIESVKKAACHFGLAFQIADDLEDFSQDEARGGAANLALILGKEEAKRLFFKEAEGFSQEIKQLGLEKSELAKIIEILIKTGV